MTQPKFNIMPIVLFMLNRWGKKRSETKLKTSKCDHKRIEIENNDKFYSIQCEALNQFLHIKNASLCLATIVYFDDNRR